MYLYAIPYHWLIWPSFSSNSHSHCHCIVWSVAISFHACCVKCQKELPVYFVMQPVALSPAISTFTKKPNLCYLITNNGPDKWVVVWLYLAWGHSTEWPTDDWCCSSAGYRNGLIMYSRNWKWWGTDCTEHTMYNTAHTNTHACTHRMSPQLNNVQMIEPFWSIITTIHSSFSPTVNIVSVKWEHGGTCPVTLSELHPPGGDNIIFHYNNETAQYRSLADRQKMCCSLVLCPMLLRGLGRTIPSHHKQEILHFLNEGDNWTPQPLFFIGAPSSNVVEGQHIPF